MHLPPAMLSALALALALLPLAVVAAPPPQSQAAGPYRHVLHEKRDGHHHGWIKRTDSPLPRNAVLPMRIGMTQRNLEQAEDLLMAVSDPVSPRYGKLYTDEEVVSLFAPAPETERLVKKWLRSAGVKDVTVSANRQWLQFDLSVENAEDLLKSEYHAYEHVESGRMSIACDEYHLPEHLTSHVDFVLPGLRLLAGKASDLTKRHAEDTFALPNPIIGQKVPPSVLNLTVKQQLAMCDSYIFPSCIAAMYNITQNQNDGSIGNQLGIYEELSYYSKRDLELFVKSFAKNIPPNTRPIFNSIDGAVQYNKGRFPAEANLDFQISYPIIWPQNSLLYQADSYISALNDSFQPGQGLFNTFLDAIDGSYCNFTAYGITGNSDIDPHYPNKGQPPKAYKGDLQCGGVPRPNVISLSYGEAEASYPSNYQRRQCLEFLKLGMLGTTVLFCTQDAGVGARYQLSGRNNLCLPPNDSVFAPDYPANCPWVTAVGSTVLPKGANVYADEEVATRNFPSGGGFSNVYQRPAYQSAAVESYLKNHNPPYPYYNITTPVSRPDPSQTKGGQYNRGGRAYPDVSAIGDKIVVIYVGQPVLFGGTSASTPVWGALIARINEERLLRYKNPVGFINPVLYQNAHLLHDITKGDNPNCGTNGFSAAPGWDPVTGLGTPDYQKLLALFLSLP